MNDGHDANVYTALFAEADRQEEQARREREVAEVREVTAKVLARADRRRRIAAAAKIVHPPPDTLLGQVVPRG